MKENDQKMEERPDKEYILGELEKLSSDRNYYLRNKTKTKRFIDLNSGLLNRLKKAELTEQETKVMKQTSNWIAKLRKLLR